LRQNRKGKNGQELYTKLSDDKIAAYLEKLRISRQQKKAAALGANVVDLGASRPLLSAGKASNYFLTYYI
jgi:hypothetical protein